MGDAGGHILRALRLGAGDDQIVRVGQLHNERLPLPIHLLVLGDDIQGGLFAGGHVHLRPAVPHRANGSHNLLHGGLLGGEVQIVGGGGPGGNHNALALMGNGLPNLLGDKGHKGMQQP